LPWFVAVHASVPFIMYVRKHTGVPKQFVPITIGAAIAGQYVGGLVPGPVKKWSQERREKGMMPLRYQSKMSGPHVSKGHWTDTVTHVPVKTPTPTSTTKPENE
jgi:hypothetical protein